MRSGKEQVEVMKTSTEYRESIKKMKPNLYIGGERVGRDDSRIQPGINVMGRNELVDADIQVREATKKLEKRYLKHRRR